MRERLRRYLSFARRTTGSASPYDSLLSATVKDSDIDDHVVSNATLASGYHPFIVDADVKDSDGNDFTIFS